MAELFFLGPRGTLSEVAARKAAPDDEHVACMTISDVFESAETGRGLVPIENSVHGSIDTVHDLLLESDLSIAGEVFFPVDYCLLTRPGESADEADRLYVHPEAAERCAGLLRRLGLETVFTPDAASAAQAVKEMGGAAIASALAASLFSLHIAEESVQDEEEVSRFLVLSREAPGKAERSKTSIVFSTLHQPGALYSALGAFAGNDLNLTRIVSRPLKREPGEHSFFVDLQGHVSDDDVAEALAELEESASFLKVLGSYPAAEMPG